MKIFKNILKLFPVIALLIVHSSIVHANTTPDSPTSMRINLLTDAYSISVDNPSFSWVVQDIDKDEIQTAYRLVFSKKLSDASDGIYFFDTGWVVLSNSTAVVVNELPALLERNSSYYWQVQTKDRQELKARFPNPHLLLPKCNGQMPMEYDLNRQ